MKRYMNASEVVWCQEEPQNQGRGTRAHCFRENMRDDQKLYYAGRPPSAAPAWLHGGATTKGGSTGRAGVRKIQIAEIGVRARSESSELLALVFDNPVEAQRKPGKNCNGRSR